MSSTVRIQVPLHFNAQLKWEGSISKEVFFFYVLLTDDNKNQKNIEKIKKKVY